MIGTQRQGQRQVGAGMPLFLPVKPETIESNTVPSYQGKDLVKGREILPRIRGRYSTVEKCVNGLGKNLSRAGRVVTVPGEISPQEADSKAKLMLAPDLHQVVRDLI